MSSMKVTLLASISADGFIAPKSEGSSLLWTSREDTRFFVQMSKEIGTLLMGSKTFDTIQEKHLPFKDRTIVVLSNSKKISNYKPSEIRVASGTPSEVLQKLSDEGVSKVAITGGASIYTQFMKAGVVDDLYITVESALFGDGIKLFNAEISTKISLIEVIDLSDQTKVFHYEVNKSDK